MSPIIALILLAAAGACLVIAGAYIILGAGAALMLAGICLILAALIIRAGLGHDA